MSAHGGSQLSLIGRFCCPEVHAYTAIQRFEDHTHHILANHIGILSGLCDGVHHDVPETFW
ncbi:hypothetical protein ASJ79_17980 [Mycobacterium sp. NAZ190054]|nr:hypothetical protein ASJ79_17980 [Mycobacterium sp. NAZ190054]